MQALCISSSLRCHTNFCFHRISNNPAFAHLVFFTQFFQVVHWKEVFCNWYFSFIRFLYLWKLSSCQPVKWKASAACRFYCGSRSVTSPHGLSNYIDFRYQSSMQCRHLKILTCKGTLQQVFIRVYWLEIQSVMLSYFRPSFVNCCPSNLLSSSVLPPPFPLWISILHTRIQYERGDMEFGPQTDKHLPQSPLQVNFIRWRNLALVPI